MVGAVPSAKLKDRKEREKVSSAVLVVLVSLSSEVEMRWEEERGRDDSRVGESTLSTGLPVLVPSHEAEGGERREEKSATLVWRGSESERLRGGDAYIPAPHEGWRR